MTRIACTIGLILSLSLIASKLRAEVFTDSLHFIIHNEKIVTVGADNYLQFDVSVMRPNTNWNDGDFYMGEGDFYFTFNEQAFAKGTTPKISALNENIDPYSPANAGASYLQASVKTWWASSSRRLLLSVDQIRTGGKTKKLLIPHKDTCFIATLQWKVATGNYAPQIAWDSLSSGIITMGNNPAIPTWVGGIDKYPEASIQIDNKLPATLEACEGSDVMLYVNARSTGDALKYQWRYYDKATGTTTNNLDMTPGAHSAAGFDYWVQGSGDTLILRHAAAVTDSMKFECYVSDATLPSSAYKTEGPVQLFLRDSMHVFLASAKDPVPQPGASEVGICPTAKNTTVRLYIWGPGAKEAREIYDLRYSYAFVNEEGSMKMLKDTVRTGETNYVKDPVSGRLYYYKQLTVSEPGEYYVKNASTSSCYDTRPLQIGSLSVDTLMGNARPYAEYDTLRVKFSTSPDTTLLPRLAVNIGGEVNLMTDISGKLDQIRNLYPAFGAVQLNPDDTTYLGKAAGLDSVLYIRRVDGCEEYSLREVEVVNSYYLTAKVYLEGGMINEESGMRCYDWNVIPNDNVSYFSPYADSMQMKISFDSISAERKLNIDGGIWCDWIYLEIRDTDGSLVASSSALLRHDGIICDTTGIPGVGFKNLENRPYYILIKHQHHLTIMSRNMITLKSAKSLTVEYDFTNPDNIYRDEAAIGSIPLKLYKGVYCMFAGDLNRDGRITNNESTLIKEQQTRGGNYKYDLNQDNVVQFSIDKVFISDNDQVSVLIPFNFQ